MTVAYISLLTKKGAPNSKVKNHEVTLKTLGYNVTSDGVNLHIECSELVTTAVDLTDVAAAGEFVKTLIASKKLLSYGCSFKVVRKSDGEVTTLQGIHGCARLNDIAPNLSCLVAKAKLGKTAAPAAFSLADLMG